MNRSDYRLIARLIASTRAKFPFCGGTAHDGIASLTHAVVAHASPEAMVIPEFEMVCAGKEPEITKPSDHYETDGTTIYPLTKAFTEALDACDVGRRLPCGGRSTGSSSVMRSVIWAALEKMGLDPTSPPEEEHEHYTIEANKDGWWMLKPKTEVFAEAHKPHYLQAEIGLGISCSLPDARFYAQRALESFPVETEHYRVAGGAVTCKSPEISTALLRMGYVAHHDGTFHFGDQETAVLRARTAESNAFPPIVDGNGWQVRGQMIFSTTDEYEAEMARSYSGTREGGYAFGDHLCALDYARRIERRVPSAV